MSNRDTFNASIKTAGATKLASDLTNEVARQTTIDAQRAGYTLQTGSYSALKAAYDSAAKAKIAADIAAEAAKNASIMVARDTLRDTGDRAPF
jgi:hypothetical protein